MRAFAVIVLLLVGCEARTKLNQSIECRQWFEGCLRYQPEFRCNQNRPYIEACKAKP